MTDQPRPILILIDDEPTLTRAIARMVAAEFEVRIYASGTVAVEALRLVDADVAILCDMHLADTTGIRVYDQLSLLRPELAERMLFMTGGSGDEPELQSFLEEHRDHVLYKPFKKEDLLARLAQATRPDDDPGFKG